MRQLILSAALLLLAGGCASNQSAPPTQASAKASSSAATCTMCDVRNAPTTRPTASAKPINKYCAVDRDDAVDPTVTYLYQGKVIGFCCEDCIPKFKADPEKYMKGLK